jgi:catechol 2,3-dioxygenase-like lactoylglutathione lyase family enzyme
VLLIFNPALAARGGRPVPSHGASGPGHIAFSVDHGALIAWRDHFVKHGIAIEKENESDGNGQLYVRDPARNSVELVAGDIWPR